MSDFLECTIHGAHTGSTCPRCSKSTKRQPKAKKRTILYTSPLAKQNRHTVQFTIPGQPQSKQRPQFSRKTGKAYTPKKTRTYEAKVGQYASFTVTVPYVVPLFVHLKFYRLIQKGQKPDIDNLAKAILDGMQGVVYKNDDIVRKLFIEIEYIRENPRCEVFIAPATNTQAITERIAA